MAAAAAPPGGADLTLAFVGELVADQLAIEAIHRIVRGLSADDVRVALARDFDLVPAPAPTPALLPELTLDSATVTAAGWTCQATAPVSCTGGRLQPGAANAVEITVVTTVASSTADATQLVNTATVSAVRPVRPPACTPAALSM